MPADPDQVIRLGTPVGQLPYVTVRGARQLQRLGIRSVSDLIRHLPARYERELEECSVAELPMNQIGSTRGTIVDTRWVPAGSYAARRWGSRFEATLEDHSARILLTWFNSPFLRGTLLPGMLVRVCGKTKVYRGKIQMVNPRWESLNENAPTMPAPQRLRPIYPSTEDLSSVEIERIIAEVLPQVADQMADPLAESFVRQRNMPALADAHRQVHRPSDEDEALGGRRRLAFNEFLLLQLGIMSKRHYQRTALEAPALGWNRAIDAHIRQRFNFKLTAAQDRVIAQIVADLRTTRPMNRLLQGDVGSGKTVVALYALLMAVAERKQGALMAPTELLAEQHHMSICGMLEGSSVRIALMTAGHSAAGSAQRATVQRQIESGQVDLVIGTQALLAESVRFRDLAVVVTDEQHRFGVLQRAQFRERGSGGERRRSQRQSAPHNLLMTATPIPRTLGLVVFGDLDVSTIDALPPGRTPITTRVVAQNGADKVYRYLSQRVDRGAQAYVVVPTIDASGRETAAQLASVRDHVKLLRNRYCARHRVEAVHGRLKRPTRQAIMERFRRGQIQVLVATTVIEVGLDVPNATLMIVEHAERFGLAQLHQLRGRIGRGSHGRRSLCVFIADPSTAEAAQRMEAIGSTRDGFKIAEHDLRIRGIGEFFGTKQHGAPPLRVGRIPEDLDLLQLARRDAETVVAADPYLTEPKNQGLRSVLLQQY
ncbi:MAG: ATP-dependent DNA helicase RecG, partial [Pirellulaceae bacterium]|nr:ATP-dependent DNA helicase RecG [Pirellulaceae bacterium]